METKFNQLLIERSVRTLRCLLNPTNISIIEILSTHGFLKRGEISKIFDNKSANINNNINTLKKHNILIKANYMGSISYAVNKELLENVLNFLTSQE